MNQVVLVLGLVLAIGVVCYLSQRGIHRTTYVVQKASKDVISKDPEVENLQDTDFLISPEPQVYQRAYTSDPGAGPYPGAPLNVPVPRGSLKMSSEEYGFPFYQQYRPLHPYDYFRPYGPNQPGMQKEIVYANTPTYATKGRPLELGFGYTADPAIPPGGVPKQLPVGYVPPYTGFGAIPFYTSVSSYAPFPEINTPWEKVGLLTTVDPQNDAILNLYRRPIAPLQDLFDYAAQDKNGFIIKLRGTKFLEDGDTVPEVIGKENLGPWKVNSFVKDKYVWA